MVINENNTHINSFTKGMNSDIAYDQIQNSQYTFAKNIRITKNQSLGGASDYSTLREGIVTPVPKGELVSNQYQIYGSNGEIEILSVDSVDDIHILVCSDEQDNLLVERINLDDYQASDLIWKSDKFFKGYTKKEVSTVLYKELDNIVKLYIATGIKPIIELRVDNDAPDYTGVDVDYLINNRIIPKDRIYINKVISGKLPASQVQYTYRFYNKYGNTTQLAPLTNKIQVISSSRDEEIGNAEGTETSKGLQLRINTNQYGSLFNRIQVYRLTYTKPNEDSEISLIYDENVKSKEYLIIDDTGLDALQTLTIEEFSSLSGLILIPKHITNNQNYMFCANVQDDTIIEDLNIHPTAPTPVYTEVTLVDKCDGGIPQIPSGVFENYIKDYNTGQKLMRVSSYFEQRGVNPAIPLSTYNDMFTSSLLRSLRRGEDYKYGIIYYDDKGRRSDVKSIGIITTDEIDYQSDKSIPFTFVNNKLSAQPIGVKIELPQPEDSKGNLINGIVGCQIVRRSSSDIYQKTLLQVALARPIQQGLALLNKDEDSYVKSPFYPTGFLTTNNITVTPPYYYDWTETLNLDVTPILSNTRDIYGAYVDLKNPKSKYEKFQAKTQNKTLFQIFSSEIDYRRNDVLERLNISNPEIREYLYLYPTYKRYGDISYSENCKKDVCGRDYEVGLTFFGIIENSWSNVQVEHNQNGEYTFTAEQQSNTWSIPTSIFNGATSVIFNLLDDIPSGANLYIINGGSRNIINSNDDLMQKSAFISSLNNNKCEIVCQRYAGVTAGYVSCDISGKRIKLTVTATNTSNTVSENELTIHKDCCYLLSQSDKQNVHWVFDFFNKENELPSTHGRIKQIKDVKIANWSDGFSNIQRKEGTTIIDGIQKYKSFTTTIGQDIYNNWISQCKYNLKVGSSQSVPNQQSDYATYAEFMKDTEDLDDWLNSISWYDEPEDRARAGYIGPGPSCFLALTDNDFCITKAPKNEFYTSICNIQHSAKNSESEEQTVYYGFGNYFKLKLNQDGTQYVIDDETNSSSMIVFDGDIYITPHEFTTMYKAYDFQSADSLQSTQITNYIPLESKVNTYFDYGKNLLNTQSANLIYEPGSIEGVVTQERPAHQYNMIYSDNDASNDVFTLISTDKDETNIFKQRAYFSEPKTNGEFIDSYQIFKPASFIDVDSKYGPITHLFTDKNMLYYWQENAFGKFSVNERSLINDTNGNTIMLGQAGILSRYDYISTKYGMREGDMCACSAAQKVFWVDINNKAIVSGNSEQAINYGEQLGVQNIINNIIFEDRPYIHYDLQNDELLCKISKNEQLIFNTKYNIATSLYTRNYNDILNTKNHLYGLFIDNDKYLNIIKYNYLTKEESKNKFLSPMELQFVVNPNASITKVFDNQQIVPIKRNEYKSSLVDVIKASFKTDIYDKVYAFNSEIWTDREGNILYAIPRWGNEQYGNRLRGKWMETEFTTNSPTDFTTISHVITKFRQSFS